VMVIKNLSEAEKNIRGRNELELKMDTTEKMSKEEIEKFFGSLNEQRITNSDSGVSGSIEEIPKEQSVTPEAAS